MIVQTRKDTDYICSGISIFIACFGIMYCLFSVLERHYTMNMTRYGPICSTYFEYRESSVPERKTILLENKEFREFLDEYKNIHLFCVEKTSPGYVAKWWILWSFLSFTVVAMFFTSFFLEISEDYKKAKDIHL